MRSCYVKYMNKKNFELLTTKKKRFQNIPVSVSIETTASLILFFLSLYLLLLPAFISSVIFTSTLALFVIATTRKKNRVPLFTLSSFPTSHHVYFYVKRSLWLIKCEFLRYWVGNGKRFTKGAKVNAKALFSIDEHKMFNRTKLLLGIQPIFAFHDVRKKKYYKHWSRIIKTKNRDFFLSKLKYVRMKKEVEKIYIY